MLECINLINKIQLAVERKHSFIILSGELSKSTKELLNLLEENGWICFYKQSKVKDILKTQVKFRFNSMRKNIINSIKLIGNNKDATFISITNLWKKNKGQSTLVLNTSKGLITDQKARQLNVGGKLFLVIN